MNNMKLNNRLFISAMIFLFAGIIGSLGLTFGEFNEDMLNVFRAITIISMLIAMIIWMVYMKINDL